MVLVRVGAAGFRGIPWDFNGETHIVHILVSYSSGSLNSLQFTFLQDDGNLYTPRPIGCPNLTGRSFEVITFKGGDEYITKVEGLYIDGRNFGSIKRLRIHTNIQVYNIFEAEGDLTSYKKFSFKFGGLHQFGGFHGSSYGGQISSIGVCINQLEALPPNFKFSSATRPLKRVKGAPSQKTPMSTLQEYGKVDPSSRVIQEILELPLLESAGVGSNIDRPGKKDFTSLALSQRHLFDDAISPRDPSHPPQDRESESEDRSPTPSPKKKKAAPKRKRPSKAEKAKEEEEEDEDDQPISKKKRKASAAKSTWKDTREWLEPWIFKETLIQTYRSEFPEYAAEIDRAVELLEVQGWLRMLNDPVEANLKQVQKFYKFFTSVQPLVARTASIQSQFHWDGEDQTVKVRDFAKILDLVTDQSFLRISQKRNWSAGSKDVICGIFGEKLAKQRKPKDVWKVVDLPIHLRIVHAVIITMVMPRSTGWDRVNPADAEVLWEVENKRLVDTPQILMYGMQCSVANTREKLVLPHLVCPILEHLGLSHEMEDSEKIGRIFLPTDLRNLILHGDLGYEC